MDQVFISYSRRDISFVKRLAADLQTAGVKVWYDLSGLEAGTRWGREIQNALRGSQYFLVVLSPHSVESEWVEREFIYASNLKLKIVPVYYKECELPLWSLNMHYLVLNEENYREELGNLLKLLGVKPKPEQPPAEVVAPPIITPEVIEEPVPSIPLTDAEKQVTTQPTGKMEETAVFIPPGSGEVEKEQEIALPAVETPVLQPKTEEIPPLVSEEEQVEAIPAPAVERKTEPDKEVKEKKPKKPVKVKPAPRVKEKVKIFPRPGVKKAWVLGMGGFGAVILLILGILFFSGDIKAALTNPSPQPMTATFTLTASPETTTIATPPIDTDGIRLADGMQMVYVPAGEFSMGSDEGEENEQPAHPVYLDAYWIDQTEVNNAMYKLCVSMGVCQWPYTYTSSLETDANFLSSSVVRVDWKDAKTYCEWAGGRLPTEAEWEKAARGTDGRMYPWGNDEPTCDLASFTSADCDGGLNPANSFSSVPSPYGAYNLAGNAWEWVADWYGAYPGILERNPTGPESGEEHILRGGSWKSPTDSLRTSYRYASPSKRSDTIGFRCALPASEEVSAPAVVPVTVTAAPTAVATSISPIDGMPMVHVPEGEFSMGSDEYTDTQPVHTVYLDEFWIDQTEVTNGMYQLCVGAGECDMPDQIDVSFGDYYGYFRYDNFPVLYITWNNAQAYCQWAGRRLPTEAEWEKAARGTDARTYPWGEEIPNCSLANFMVGSAGGCDGIYFTHAVGLLPAGASPYGVYDMAGNVSEWVADWYSETYYGESSSDNPIGPSSGVYRVLRGGSFEGITYSVKTFYRNWIDPTNSKANLGFRCVSSTAP